MNQDKQNKLQQLQDRLHAAANAIYLLKRTIEVLESDICFMQQQVTDIVENN